MLTATATAPSHRENTAMTFAETAHKIANMVAMLTHHDSRLKMPRPAAYRRAQAHTNSLAAHPASHRVQATREIDR